MERRSRLERGTEPLRSGAGSALHYQANDNYATSARTFTQNYSKQPSSGLHKSDKKETRWKQTGSSSGATVIISWGDRYHPQLSLLVRSRSPATSRRCRGAGTSGEGTIGFVLNRGLEGIQAVIERQQRVPATSNHDSVFFGRKHSRACMVRSAGQIGFRAALPPPGDRPRRHRVPQHLPHRIPGDATLKSHRSLAPPSTSTARRTRP